MEDKNCFNTPNFLKVKEYIIFRLSVSGMGKFYVEYPAPSKVDTEDRPGNKKMPENPENVYNISIDEINNEIIFERSQKKINFNSTKGYYQTTTNGSLAHELFCYLLDMAK